MIDALSDGENLSEDTLLKALHTFLGTLEGFIAETAHEAISGRFWPFPAEPVECAYERHLQRLTLLLSHA